MEKKKIRSRKIVKYGMAFLIPIICIVIHMMMTDCYPFGKNTILLGDSNTQYYAFFVELSGRIRQGKYMKYGVFPIAVWRRNRYIMD